LTGLRRQPPRTLDEAITTVGFEALRNILVAASLRASRADDAASHRLWEHALATALAADELAHLDGLPRGGSVFIAGLLHDTGKLLFHLSDAKAFASLRAAVSRPSRRASRRRTGSRISWVSR